MRLVTGDVGCGRSSLCLSEIREAVLRGEKCLYLVPEQETVNAEAAAAELLPARAALCFEVTNFTRLANTVFRREGGLALPYATPDTKALLMHKVLRQTVRTPGASAAGPDAGQVRKALRDVRSLHLARLTENDLLRAQSETDDPRLQEKLGYLAQIFGAYESALKKTYTDSETDLDKLAEVLAETHPLRGVKIWVDSFNSFTMQQYEVLRCLLADCDVTVTLCMPPEPRTLLSAGELTDTRRRLEKLAAEAGHTVQVTDLGPNRRQSDPGLGYICRRLWKADPGALVPWEGEKIPLTMAVAEDPFEAAEWVAADIRRRVRSGLKYEDFAVVCADASRYAGVIDAACARADVPCFLSVKTNVASYEPIKFIQAAYAAAVGRRQRADVMAWLKCDLTGIDPADVDIFGLYTEQWNLNGKDLKSSKPFSKNPKGYKTGETPGSLHILERANAVKKEMDRLLSPFEEAVSRAVTAADHCRALAEFLLSCDVESKLAARSAELRAVGEELAADDYAQLWKTICLALDRFFAAVGDEEMSADDFREQLKLVFEASELGRIPSGRDRVTVGSAPTLRIDGKKVLYLFGVVEDEFPAPPVSCGLFSEEEAETLREIGLTFEAENRVRQEKELFFFYRMLAAPSEEAVTVTFRYDCGRTACNPAAALLRLQKLAGNAAQAVDIHALPPEALLPTPRSGLARMGLLTGTDTGHTLARWYRDHGMEEAARRAEIPLLTENAAVSPETSRRVWEREIPLSQTKLDKFSDCPFAFHQQFVLQLSDNEPAEFGSREIGTFVHALLERFMKDGGPGRDMTEEQALAYATAAAEGYMRSLLPPGDEPDARVRHYVKRLSRLSSMILLELRDECRESGFLPSFFEMRIGESGHERPGSPVLPALTYPLSDGRTATLAGAIDRVDLYSREGVTYLRVVDYKTGTKDFKATDLEQGKNMQMMLYLDALLRSPDSVRQMAKTRAAGDGDAESPAHAGDKLVPAGVLYFNCLPREVTLDAPTTPEEEKKHMDAAMSTSGLFLDDTSVLRAMQPEGAAHKYVPVRFKQDGEPDANSLPRLRSPDEWKDLFAQLSDTVQGMAEQIASGKAPAKPLRRGKSAACKYCPYKPMCRKAVVT